MKVRRKIKNCIYVSKIEPSLNQKRYHELLQMISKENRDKCSRFKFKEDALRTLYGELMVRHIIGQQFFLRNEEIEILKGDAGKPYVKNIPVHFNISHSGDFVVCAFSEQEVGIDIEQIKEIDLKIAYRFFSKSEYEDLFQQSIIHQLDYFFSLWTLKESYLKWIGSGMAIPLDSFCFKITDAGISLLDKNRKALPFFKQIWMDGYKLAVCSMMDNFPDQVEKISIEKIGIGYG
ncbi:MAG: 4'-phosphopantetheinyl transferase superfamily protein [Lachnospiraceae bacterium]|nr:4'-phosphopantetheinyl transferase superfamily protein [Lachnospiraceae bacterium]